MGGVRGQGGAIPRDISGLQEDFEIFCMRGFCRLPVTTEKYTTDYKMYNNLSLDVGLPTWNIHKENNEFLKP